MSTALMGRRKTATYLHLVRELLYKIDWPSRRRLTYWHFVHVYAFRARVTYILWLSWLQFRGTLGVGLSRLQVCGTLGVGLKQRGFHFWNDGGWGNGGQELYQCTMTEKHWLLIGNIQGQYITFPFFCFILAYLVMYTR